MCFDELGGIRTDTYSCYLSSSTTCSPILCLKSVAKYIASMPPSVPLSMPPSSGTARYAVLDRTRVPVLESKLREQEGHDEAREEELPVLDPCLRPRIPASSIRPHDGDARVRALQVAKVGRVAELQY